MSVSNNDALIDATQTQAISSGDERDRNRINDLRLKAEVSIKKARLMADDNQLEEAKDIIVNAQCLLYDEDFVELDTLKSDLEQLLMLMKTQETYEKQGRAFALLLETSHDSHDLAERGNEGPSVGTGKTKLRIIRKREAPLEESKFKVMLELSSNETTPGLDLVTVLDISGSMRGEKLLKMKSAMKSVIEKLSPIDRLSVVTFSSHSNRLCALNHMTEYSKEEIKKRVNDLHALGGTNISAGVEKSLQVLMNESPKSRRQVAIMLLCDGEQDPQDPDAAEVEIDNVPVYTFGLGSYYDPRVLKAIANKSSGGMFTDVRNVDKLEEAFSQCLDRLLRLVVQDLKVTITQGNSTKIEQVSAETYRQYGGDIGSVIVPLGHLYEKEPRKVTVDLLLPDCSSTKCVEVLNISYTYSFRGKLIRTRPKPVTITRRNSAPMINEAREVTDNQLKIANKMIIKAQKLLRDEVDETLNYEVQQLKRLMNSQKLYNEQETEEETIDETHHPTAESGEGTIRSLETSTVHSDNYVIEHPIEFLLDPTGVRQRISDSLNRSNNDANWSEKVEKYLKDLNLWRVIEDPPMETTESEENVDMHPSQNLKKFRENWMALILINQACRFPKNLQIIDLDSARAAWETLTTNERQTDSVKKFLSAGERGDWKTVEREFNSSDSKRELAKAIIPSSQSTVLHMASLVGEVNIVKKLVEVMERQDLEIQDKDGYTALAKASINGDKRIAECMVAENERLVSIPTGTKLLPVVIAVMYKNKQMTSYLYSKTPEEVLTNNENKSIHGATLLTYSIKMQFYDISFKLIQNYPRLAVTLDHNGQSALYQLACMPSAFHSGSKLKFWQTWMYNCVYLPRTNRRNAGSQGIKRIYEMKSVRLQSLRLVDLICKQIKDDLDDDETNCIINALHEAAAWGVVEFVYGVLKFFPEFRWLRDKKGSTIFMKAVQFRQADVFSLIHRFPSKDKMMVSVDKCGENILHKLEYSSVDKISTIQGGLLKMQKELKWLQEIKSMMPPGSLEKQNNEKKTAQQLFDESHKELIINAEKGMKETANSCIIVGILVVTIMFAAAFAVPGGNDQDTGFPLFLNINLFKIFIISDALSLCFSTTSVLMFLGILTSRYAEKDFLEALPRKMIIALSSLFISITAMMIAFTTTLFIMLLRTGFWISLPITTLFASLPVILFAQLLFPLLSEYVMSTYGSSIFNPKSKL